jgi:multidrug efflux pump subunit AcrA (membrane-fusion protein)
LDGPDILKNMPTPLSTAGVPAGADAWQELEEVLAELVQLAHAPITPEAFYDRALAASVRALSGVGGAVWLRSPSGVLRPVAHLDWPGAELTDANARRKHEHLLSDAAEQGRVVSFTSDSHPMFAAPVSLAAGVEDPTPSQRAAATVAIFEIVPRADISPAAHRGYEQFLAALAEVAAEFHAYHELSRLRGDEAYHEQLVRLSTLVHRHIDLTPTAYAVANEGRRVIGCDRLSVLALSGRRCRLLATSGASRVERRSSAARNLEQLAGLVCPTGEPAYYADGNSDALPPIADALEQHAEESHARQIAVLPLVRSLDADESQRPLAATKPSFVLIAEQFDARHGELQRSRLVEVGELCATALYNAQDIDQLPFRWLLRPLGSLKQQIAMHLTRSMLIAGLIATILAGLVLVPADFAIEAPGTLEPAVRRDVFAPRSGLVEKVLVGNGADVAAGEPLVELRDPKLELELKRVHGEMETVRRQLDAVRATKTNRDIRDASPTEFYRLSASEREFDQQLTNLQHERELLDAQRETLVVRSPIAGRVLTWDVANRLAARPVERGDVLVTVADLSADWQLDLNVEDDRIGHVLAARDAADAPLPVRFRLRSQDSPHTGHIAEIGLTADVAAAEGAATDPTVRVTVAFDKDQLNESTRRDLRPGVSARAEIDCGRRSLGYVWFHDLWDALLTWLRF